MINIGCDYHRGFQHISSKKIKRADIIVGPRLNEGLIHFCILSFAILSDTT
jgi:hypothetical protein